MRTNILILGGTTEARLLGQQLAIRDDRAVTLSLAGRTASPLAQAVPVRSGGFGGTAGLVQIAQEKYVALYTDGGQAWDEWRRTCIPATIQPGPAATQSNVPRRFQYSVTEKSVNAANLAAANTQQGGTDSFSTRMYWDKSPSNAPTWNPPFGPGATCGVRGQAPSPGAP